MLTEYDGREKKKKNNKTAHKTAGDRSLYPLFTSETFRANTIREIGRQFVAPS